MGNLHWWRAALALLAGCAGAAMAAGPERVATTDRGLWPYKIDTPAGFDQASRAEILALANAWETMDTPRDAGAWTVWLGIKSADVTSIARWRDQATARWAENFVRASGNCHGAGDLLCPPKPLHTWPEIVQFARDAWSALPEPLRVWSAEQRRFYATYLYEQARLAALFPHVTSEILAHDGGEILGTDYPDKTFLLTFDDGPSPVGGETDQLITELRRDKVDGVFFILGDRLQERLVGSTRADLRALYSGMCVASHGAVHQPHPRLATWRQSIDETNAALAGILPEGQAAVKYFRPPYGQRTPEISRYVAGLHQQNMLWNMDSQDWNPHITAPQVSSRMLTLMLLWRRGILLFHDVHPKARVALPDILAATRSVGLSWMSCR
jgi:peptidoglycan/xylan/chitin deacetylase (PgdA/CDA1 family)